ncbi:splicing arginine serine-rich protein, putative [Babesia ovata]|uniref:Splicing arginine serine-rich protein, putative n=1 Tax=Babesia ovata TaxID=189622 RepID=A0A2H6KI36_9APIC|nr:splicing arginine serine-rich protein, putative [Babesia ovata]GBE62639.1 splicing arginine serine-rich protein, putative [Babesia ovata]
MEDRDPELPPQLLRVIPAGRMPDRAVLLDMAYTACMVRKEGEAFEFRLKIHAANEQVPFLDSSHPLHECYTCLKRNEGGALSEFVSSNVPDHVRKLFVDAPKPSPPEVADRNSVSYSEQTTSPGTVGVPKDKSAPGKCLIHGYSDSE